MCFTVLTATASLLSALQTSKKLSSARWVFLLPWRHLPPSRPCQDGPNHLTSWDKVNLSSFTLLLPDSLSSQTRKVAIWDQDINIACRSFLFTTTSLYRVQFLGRTSYWHGPMRQANCRHSISKHSPHYFIWSSEKSLKCNKTPKKWEQL